MRSTFTYKKISSFQTALRKPSFKILCVLFLSFFSVQLAQAQFVYAVSASGNLISFNAHAPGAILSNVPLSGMAAGQVMEGLDFRPATGQLYALGYNASNGQAQVYTIKTATGALTAVGSAITLAVGMTYIGFDFNPTVDRIRVTSSTRQNYRLNPNDGTLAANDGTLTYAATDPNAATTPNVVTGAYTNSLAGATATTLYFYDFNLKVLGTVIPPNNGTLNTIGSSVVTANNAIGLDLDIATDPETSVNTAYLSADITGSANNFYTVDLTTGAAGLVGAIAGEKIIEMAVLLHKPANKLVYAVSGSNLISFYAAAPGAILSTVAITGLGAGERILGMDFRPATGQLYALGSLSRLYIINITTGVATQVGTDGAFALNGTKFGFDFNPLLDRIRVVSTTEQNLRLNPNDGTLTAVDGALAFSSRSPNAGTNPTVGAVAYTSDYSGATNTTLTNTALYFYDYNLKSHGFINPPNEGRLITLGSLGVTLTDVGLDMDISSDPATNTNIAFLTGGTGSTATNLYRINLATGALTMVGTIGGGMPIEAMAIYMAPPPPAKQVYALTTTGNLISFSANALGTIRSNVAITGITPGQSIEGLDFRPANNQLYALGYNATTGETQLYQINTSSGAASMVGAAITLATNMGKLAVDFNPQVDRIRVIGSNGMNYRINPDNGALAATDTPLSYAPTDQHAGTQPVVHAAAYTNNFAGTTATTLYYYDFNLDNLAATLPPVSPNMGQLNTLSSSGLSTVSGVDMDIITDQSTGVNLVLLTANVLRTAANFYTIDLVTGEVRTIGQISESNLITEMAVSTADVVMPVTLTNFSVKKTGLASELAWTTQNELNNDYFIIERSTNGRTFKSISGKIASKASNGNSIRKLDYSFFDGTPEKGTNFYRLAQADKDGNISYSNVLKVSFDGQYEMRMYPNPVKSVLNINGHFPQKHDISLKITDGSGKTVVLHNYKNQQGNWNVQIPLEGLSKGVYYVKISEGVRVIHTQSVYKD